MKKTIILFFLITVSTYSQEPLEYDNIIEVNSIEKDKLFEVLNDWTAITFNSANDVIQLSDKDNGKLIIKGVKNYSLGRLLYNCYDGFISFTLKIVVKDNKYRITILQLKHNSMNNNSCSLGLITKAELFKPKGFAKREKNKIWKDLKVKSSELNKSILNSIKEKINNYSSEEKW